MAHLSIAAPSAANNFGPIEQSFERISKDGNIPVMTFLLGSHYNTVMDGEVLISATGNITNDAVTTTGGKLNITGESTDGSTIEKLVTFNSFAYFYPGTKFVGHNEVADADVGSGPVPIQRMEYVFEDLASGDKLIIRLEGEDGNAKLKLVEEIEARLVLCLERPMK